ncbi:hypothetical protein CCR94_16100 [Rhodoblastus sphagnicola]|uniref:Global cell cycle regulator GcrA-like protein n=1 Tax=Rhodoblastus sphagnicola TaxID=333368 RepID=A0A2S6N3B7_9HYPH|nr:GcrA family cell cycle regulator [Rhodoblastus sphagnicola]MBB4200856.1 GcrA cell cycle regulator [Rhodoblastus sphagnicola]PPQ29121.1 hypothetical protein CCR94_16100 [Rhodoblastus sphagnicola]
MIWDETCINRLKDFWAEGKSASAIAAEFGTTKNAVIGKLNRLGLAFKQGKPLAIEDEAVSQSAAVPTPARKEPVMEMLPIAKPAARRVALNDLTATSCRWPIGDPRSEDFGFCGAPKAIGDQPYCPSCRRLAYAPIAKTMRKAS